VERAEPSSTLFGEVCHNLSFKSSLVGSGLMEIKNKVLGFALFLLPQHLKIKSIL